MIYLAEMSNGFYKVGFSDDPQKRESGLRSEFGQGIRIIAVFDGDTDDEKMIHKELSECNVRYKKNNGKNSVEVFGASREYIEDIMFSKLNNGIYFDDYIELLKNKPTKTSRYIKINHRAHNELLRMSACGNEDTVDEFLNSLILGYKDVLRKSYVLDTIKDVINGRL